MEEIIVKLYDNLKRLRLQLYYFLGNEVCEPSNRRGDSADEESKRNSASDGPAKAKRPRCENTTRKQQFRDFSCNYNRWLQNYVTNFKLICNYFTTTKNKS